MTINKQTFEQLYQLKPKRIYLPIANALKKTEEFRYGILNFAFSETIQRLFEKDNGLKLLPNRKNRYNENSLWHSISISNKDEYQTIEQWIKVQGTTVFIRSLLPLCLALDVNIDYPNQIETDIGNLESQAKNQQDEEAIDKLTKLLCKKIQNTAFYKDTPYIVAVPASHQKFDLPTCFAIEIAEKLGLTDLTNHFSYKYNKPTLKDKTIENKWDILEKSGLTFNYNEINTNKTIILLDDKYQSGVTLHYVASKIEVYGFTEIYGLTVVKTVRDDDNQTRNY